MKCLCNHCSQEIEFGSELVGKKIQCPECNLETLLYNKGETKHPDVIAQEERESRETARLKEAQEANEQRRREDHRVCKNCEKEVHFTNRAEVFAGSLVLAFLAACGLALFSFALSGAMVIVVVFLAVYFGATPVCPECKRPELVQLGTPAASRILGEQ